MAIGNQTVVRHLFNLLSVATKLNSVWNVIAHVYFIFLASSLRLEKVVAGDDGEVREEGRDVGDAVVEGE